MPTWKGWLLSVCLLLVALILLVRSAPGFLSPKKPLGAPVLVVEGWVDDASIEAAVALQKKNHYELVICSGGTIERGLPITSAGTYADLGVSRLRAFGFSGTNLVAVPSPDVLKDRTYHSALSIKRYVLEKTPYRSIDLLSGGVHSRRSWLLYRMACVPEIKVGVYGIPDPDFQTDRWFRTSAGVRAVMSEGIGYIYARFLFRPAAFEPPSEVTAFPESPSRAPAAGPAHP